MTSWPTIVPRVGLRPGGECHIQKSGSREENRRLRYRQRGWMPGMPPGTHGKRGTQQSEATRPRVRRRHDRAGRRARPGRRGTRARCRSRRLCRLARQRRRRGQPRGRFGAADRQLQRRGAGPAWRQGAGPVPGEGAGRLRDKDLRRLRGDGVGLFGSDQAGRGGLRARQPRRRRPLPIHRCHSPAAGPRVGVRHRGRQYRARAGRRGRARAVPAGQHAEGAHRRHADPAAEPERQRAGHARGGPDGAVRRGARRGTPLQGL